MESVTSEISTKVPENIQVPFSDFDRPSRAEDDHSSSSVSIEQFECLIESNRLKGYITMTFLSSLAFVSAYESDLIHSMTWWLGQSDWFLNNAEIHNQTSFINVEVVPSSSDGRMYAMVVSGVSAVLNLTIVLIHLTDFVMKTPFRKAFRPGSVYECVLLVFSTVWWIFGTWILTSLHGIAGDGRGQYNLYFSIWLSTFTVIGMVEKWLKSAGFASIYESISSWPNRAPGWIVIFISSLATISSILDIYFRQGRVNFILNGNSAGSDDEFLVWQPGIKYDRIKRGEWSFLFFTCIASIGASIGFSLVELFRREDRYVNNIKSDFEFYAEGICLAMLVMLWIPSVVYATTDGASSEIGNSYFCTWASVVVVVQTFIHWVQDWRRGVHKLVISQYQEYKQSQREVEGVHQSDFDDVDEDDESNHI